MKINDLFSSISRLFPGPVCRAILLLVFATGSFLSTAAARTIELEQIRIASWEDRFRLVLDLSGQVDPINRLVDNPDRIAINLPRTASEGIVPPAVKDWMVKKIRINHLKKNKTTQVVLDLTEEPSYRVFSLPAESGKPFRVVCDVFRQRRSEVQPESSPWVVVIDPGHGGIDPGTLDQSGKLMEKDIVLDVAKQLRAILERVDGIKVILTRERDKTCRLRQRAAVIRESNGDLFVSIHVNGWPTRAVKGAEVFFLSPKGATSAASKELEALENAADDIAEDNVLSEIGELPFAVDLIQTDTILRSSHLAETLLDELGKSGLAATRGIKQANFVVLRSTQIPSALIELGFITNPNDSRRLGTAKHRKALAETIARGLLEYQRKFGRQAHATSP